MLYYSGHTLWNDRPEIEVVKSGKVELICDTFFILLNALDVSFGAFSTVWTPTHHPFIALMQLRFKPAKELLPPPTYPSVAVNRLS